MHEIRAFPPWLGTSVPGRRHRVASNQNESHWEQWSCLQPMYGVVAQHTACPCARCFADYFFQSHPTLLLLSKALFQSGGERNRVGDLELVVYTEFHNACTCPDCLKSASTGGDEGCVLRLPSGVPLVTAPKLKSTLSTITPVELQDRRVPILRKYNHFRYEMVTK